MNRFTSKWLFLALGALMLGATPLLANQDNFQVSLNIREGVALAMSSSVNPVEVRQALGLSANQPMAATKLVIGQNQGSTGDQTPVVNFSATKTQVRGANNRATIANLRVLNSTDPGAGVAYILVGFLDPGQGAGFSGNAQVDVMFR